MALLTLPAFGQTGTPAPPDHSSAISRFEVATIKPGTPEESRTVQIRGNRFATTGTSLADLLKYAYGLQDEEIAGGPKWLKTQTFDVAGDPETEATPSSDEFKRMVQNLLGERFHLVTHMEMRELPVFEIVAAKSGPRLTKSTRPQDGIPAVGYSPGQLGVANATMRDFATFLQRFVADRPVVDGTGIAGKYDLTVRWNPDELDAEASRRGDGGVNSAPGFFTAMQEQLGLRLQPTKRAMAVLVIDHVEMPTEN